MPFLVLSSAITVHRPEFVEGLTLEGHRVLMYYRDEVGLVLGSSLTLYGRELGAGTAIVRMSKVWANPTLRHWLEVYVTGAPKNVELWGQYDEERWRDLVLAASQFLNHAALAGNGHGQAAPAVPPSSVPEA